MIERVSDELHLDAPLHEQYAAYMWRVFAHQSAGRSPAFANPSALEKKTLPDTAAVARQAIPPTLSVVILTLVVSLGVGRSGGFRAREDTLARVAAFDFGAQDEWRFVARPKRAT
jgi:ABC-type dipeptide/oligopeptide/nickel transport system permease component